MTRLSYRLLIPFQVALLSLVACESEEPTKPQAGSTAPTSGTSSVPTNPGASTPGSTAGDTDPASKIVPGTGDCPDAATLLAAPEFYSRELYTGKVNYRSKDPSKPVHRVIRDQAAYDALSKELNLPLPAIDFYQEQVVFGAVFEPASCGLSSDPLRVVTINANTHIDFTAVRRIPGVECNVGCGLVEEIATIVAVAMTPHSIPTVCTRKRAECSDKP